MKKRAGGTLHTIVLLHIVLKEITTREINIIRMRLQRKTLLE